MNKHGLGWIVTGIVVALGVVLYYFFASGEPSLEKENSSSRSVLPAVKKVRANGRKTASSKVREEVKTGKRKNFKRLIGRSMFGHMSEADKKLCEDMQKALDANDAEQTIKLSAKLMTSSNPEVRSHAVDALGWFGEKTLPELTVLMGDSNEDVAQNAINTWEVSFSEIEDTATRFNVSKMAMGAISSKEALESIGSQFSIAASEYIDEGENKKEEYNRRVEVVQSLVDMIDSPNKKLSNAGRELYEEITGHNWINISEAELYIKDPENYESP